MIDEVCPVYTVASPGKGSESEEGAVLGAAAHCPITVVNKKTNRLKLPVAEDPSLLCGTAPSHIPVSYLYLL